MIKSHKRGFVLVAVLLISIILLVSGLGIMSAQASRYAASAVISEGLQARNAALSGLEDVRVKLAKDVKFPPRKSKDRGQFKFAYSEDLSADPEAIYGKIVEVLCERTGYAPDEIEGGLQNFTHHTVELRVCRACWDNILARTYRGYSTLSLI